MEFSVAVLLAAFAGGMFGSAISARLMFGKSGLVGDFLVHGDTHVVPPAGAIFTMATVVVLVRNLGGGV